MYENTTAKRLANKHFGNENNEQRKSSKGVCEQSALPIENLKVQEMKRYEHFSKRQDKRQNAMQKFELQTE